MRILRTTLVATAAALALAVVAAAPASAHIHFGGFGPWGFGHVWHVHHWGYGYGGDSCIRWRPMFDSYGDFIGRRPVNVCY